MKLFLTSSGFGNGEIAAIFMREMSKRPEGCRGLVVAYANSKTEEYFVNEARRDLVRMGCGHVTVVNMKNHFNARKFQDYDFVYVCGGNTFSILKKMRDTRMDKFIIKQVKKGAMYIGVSAGSIIAGENVEIAKEAGDVNEVGLKNLKGLGFTDISVFPHFTEEHRAKLEEFKKRVKYPVVELTDFQAIVCVEKNHVVMG